MGRGTLAIRVWEDGSRRPVPGASVHLWNAKGKLGVGTTDDSGSFELRDLDEGWVRARVGAVGFALSDPQLKNVGEGATTALHFAMERGVAVEGVVVAKDGGAPVAGAEVSAIRGRQMMRGRQNAFQATTTDSEGRFRVYAVPRVEEMSHAAVLVFAHAEFATADVVVRPAPADPGPIHVRVEMPPGATLRGVVRDADGAAVAGAHVAARAGNMGAMRLAFGSGLSWSGGSSGLTSIDRPATTVSADDGTFALDGLEQGEDYAISAVVAGHAASTPVVLRADRDAAPVELRLRRPWNLSVRVVDVAGRPVTDATLSVQGNGSACAAASTGPGTWRVGDIGLLQAMVFVEAPGFLLVGRRLERPTGGARSVRIVMKRAQSIAGVVVDDVGAPIAGAKIWAEDSNTVDDEAGESHAPETDADGRFRLDDLSSKKHRVIAQSPRGERAVLRGVHPPADDVRVVVPRAATVRALLDPTAAEVFFAHAPKRGRRYPGGVDSDRWRYGSVPDDAGVVEVTGVPTGGAVLRLLVPGFQRVERVVDAACGETVDLGTIGLEPAIELVGRVVDADGRPVAGTVVSIEQSSPFFTRKTTPWHVQATTDDDGAFRLRGLWRGRVRLLAHTRRFDPPGFDVDVDGSTPVTFTLPPKATDDPVADELARLR